MKAVIDTNVLIDFLNGAEKARNELSLYDKPCISLITWMEVLVGAKESEEELIRNYLSGFQLIPIDREVAETAVKKRRDRGIRLPDAIIWASAEMGNLVLVTCNTRDFPADHPGIRVPY